MHNNKPALSKEEVELLKKYYKTSDIQLLREKAQVIVMRSDGLREVKIAEYTFKSIRTIQRWLKDFKTRRLASIFSGYQGNENASKLTRAQKQEIKEVLSKPPSSDGLPKEFWDVPELKRYIKAEFGVVYESDQSYHYLLKFSNLNFKYPDTHHPNRKKSKIKFRMREIRKELKELKRKDYEIYAADETGLEESTLVRRAWLKKGARTMLKSQRGRKRKNFIGFLNQETGKCELYSSVRNNNETTVRALRRILAKHPGKRVCIVWDNAAWHRSRRLKAKLVKGEEFEKVHLINLPPYAPEENPIEHVWNYAKDKLANRSSKDINEIAAEFRAIIRGTRFDYKFRKHDNLF